MDVEPVGIFHCLEQYTYDVPRQGILSGDNRGVIELRRGCNFEQALQGLEGFSHIWVLFSFDRCQEWKAMVRPPRHTLHKVGVFATRSPYRPNYIGMSCVRLAGISGLKVEVAGHDLLDGTPVLDIKPYLAYADSFPQASLGWTGQQDAQYQVRFSQVAEGQLAWLEAHGVSCIRAFILDRLGTDPLNPRRNRLVGGRLAYRTWRVAFDVGEDVLVQRIDSGYSKEELLDGNDTYQDKKLHIMFRSHYVIDEI